jgi:hypothetical protein
MVEIGAGIYTADAKVLHFEPWQICEEAGVPCTPETAARLHHSVAILFGAAGVVHLDYRGDV